MLSSKTAVTRGVKDNVLKCGIPDPLEVGKYFIVTNGRNNDVDLIGRTDIDNIMGDFNSMKHIQGGLIKMRCSQRAKTRPKCNAFVHMTPDYMLFGFSGYHTCDKWKGLSIDIDIDDSDSEDNQTNQSLLSKPEKKGGQTTLNKDLFIGGKPKLSGYYKASKPNLLNQNQQLNQAIASTRINGDTLKSDKFQAPSKFDNSITQGRQRPSIETGTIGQQLSCKENRRISDQSMTADQRQTSNDYDQLQIESDCLSDGIAINPNQYSRILTLSNRQGEQKYAKLYDWGFLDDFVSRLHKFKFVDSQSYLQQVKGLLIQTADKLDEDIQTRWPLAVPGDQLMMMQGGNERPSKQNVVENVGETQQDDIMKSETMVKNKTTTQQHSMANQKNSRGQHSKPDKEVSICLTVFYQEEKQPIKPEGNKNISIKEATPVEHTSVKQHGTSIKDEVVSTQRQQSSQNNDYINTYKYNLTMRQGITEGRDVSSINNIETEKNESMQEPDSALYQESISDKRNEIGKIIDHLNFGGIVIYLSIYTMNLDVTIGLETMVTVLWETHFFDDFKKNNPMMDNSDSRKILAQCISSKLRSFISGLTSAVKYGGLGFDLSGSFPSQAALSFVYEASTEEFVMKMFIAKKLTVWVHYNNAQLPEKFKSAYQSTLNRGWTKKIRQLSCDNFEDYDSSYVQQAYLIMREHEPKKTE